MSTPGVMIVVEQTQGYRISFELIKPNQSNSGFDPEFSSQSHAEKEWNWESFLTREAAQFTTEYYEILEKIRKI